MVTRRKTFVLPIYLLATLPDMEDTQAGQLFKTIVAYMKDEDVTAPIGLNALWKELRIDLDDNKIAYDEMVIRNRRNGRKGGRPPTKIGLAK